LKKKKILIIGGTGFIGYHLAKKCIKSGWNVTSVSAHKPKKIRFIKKVKYIICDISKKKKLYKKINAQYNYVINLGGYVDHSNSIKTFKSHFNGCKNLANYFLDKKIDTFIQMGSSGEYGKLKSPHTELISGSPKSPYARAKLNATNYLSDLYKKKRFPVITLRLYQAYGPRQDINRLIPIVIYNSLKSKNFPCSNGNQKRDFIFIDDLISLIFKCLKKNKKNLFGKILNVGTGKPIKVKKIIQHISKKTKKGKPLYGKIKMRKDEILNIYPNINKTKKLLDWRPKTTLFKGLDKTIKSYEKEINKYTFS